MRLVLAINKATIQRSVNSKTCSTYHQTVMIFLYKRDAVAGGELLKVVFSLDRIVIISFDKVVFSFDQIQTQHNNILN